MTTKYAGKPKRKTRKGPGMRNHVDSIRKDELVTDYLPDGTVDREFSNQRIGYQVAVSGVGPIVQGDGTTPLPWKYTINQDRFISGKLDMSRGGVLYQRSEGTYDSTGLSTPSWDRYAVRLACFDKLADAVRGGLDLSVDIAEAGQARQMIGKTFKLLNFVRSIPELGPLLRRAANHARDGRLGRESAKSLGHQIADRWLEFQYGWKPLLSSIYGAADEAQRMVLNKIQNFSVNASIPMGAPDSQFIRDITLKGTDRYNQALKQSCRISISMEIPTDRWNLDRWTSLNPVSIAWELAPYSYVVDWLYDIGGMLRRMETALIYDKFFKHGSMQELYYYHSAYQRKGLMNTRFSGYSFYGDLSAWVRRVEFERTVLTSLPTGQLPTIKGNLGSSQLLSAAALLSQFLKPGGKTFR